MTDLYLQGPGGVSVSAKDRATDRRLMLFVPRRMVPSDVLTTLVKHALVAIH